MLTYIINIIQSFILVFIGHSISRFKIKKGYEETSFICSSKVPFAIPLDFEVEEEYFFKLTYEIEDDIHELKGVMKINEGEKVEIVCTRNPDVRFYVQDGELMIVGNFIDEFIIGNIKVYSEN